jgi:anti-anti-sigma regulatory factor
MDVASQGAARAPEPTLNIDRLVEGDITCLRFAGIINETFDGKRLAASIKAKTLVLDFGEVRRVSSFGIREWADFIQTVERSVQRVIAIEVPPKVVDQLNMVSRFLGTKGVVYSVYVPYRCDYCDIDSRVLLTLDRDRAAIVSHDPPERTCEVCSRAEYFDEDAATFFSYLAQQPPVELGTDVADFLASKLKYAVTGAERRLQADKHVDGKNTFLRLAGNLDGSFPSAKLAEGLEGTIVVDVSAIGTIDLAGAAEWRNFVVQAKATAERIVVVGCPPVLLERLNRQGDLGDEVVSFSMPYSCPKCATTSSQPIDVAEHYEILKFATPPEMRCPQCKSATVCTAPETLLSRMRTLTRPELDGGLKKFIREARERKPAKTTVAAPRAAEATSRLGVWLGLIFVVLLGAAALLVVLVRQQSQSTDRGRPTDGPGFERPTWITADTPLAGYCNDLINRVGCVGVSTYDAKRDAAEAEASSIAVEALANSIALRIDVPAFAQKIRPRYDAARAEALADLERTQADPSSPAYATALGKVRDARQRVAEALRRTGGSAAPQQKAGWFWERYGEGAESEYLVFVRYDADNDALRGLVTEYTTVVDAGGARLVTTFPLLAWRVPGSIEGAYVLDPGPLAARGIAEGEILMEIAGQPVRNALEARDRLAAAGVAAPLSVVGLDGKRREL